MAYRATSVSEPQTFTPLLLLRVTLTMDVNIRDIDAYTESDIQHAITAYRIGEFTSIRACSGAFNIPYQTLQHRIARRLPRSISHKHRQILLNAEERTLVRWITQLTNTSFPAPPVLAIKMAEEIRRSRYQLVSVLPTYDRPISKS